MEAIMPKHIEARVEELERKVDDLTRQIGPLTKPVKDWRRTVGMSAGDPEFEEITRLGREDRKSQRWEDEPDADPGH
jgi:hypothetical protein